MNLMIVYLSMEAVIFLTDIVGYLTPKATEAFEIDLFTVKQYVSSGAVFTSTLFNTTITETGNFALLDNATFPTSGSPSIYPSVGNNPQINVTVTKITSTYIKCMFSGELFGTDSNANPVLAHTITDGEFYAKFK